MSYEKFWEWVNEIRKDRGLSWREIERRGDVANGTISRRYKVFARPTVNNCEVLAKTLQLLPREVMIEAGLINAALRDLEDATMKKVVATMRQLSPEARERVSDYASFLLSQKAEQ